MVAGSGGEASQAPDVLLHVPGRCAGASLPWQAHAVELLPLPAVLAMGLGGRLGRGRWKPAPSQVGLSPPMFFNYLVAKPALARPGKHLLFSCRHGQQCFSMGLGRRWLA